MRSAPRLPRPQAIALGRADPVLAVVAPWKSWGLVVVAVALLFAALLGR
jgi:hypothetical protein